MAELRFGGGINQQDDENTQPDECLDGRNFLLDKTSRAFRPRLPFDLKHTFTGEVNGILQLIKRDNTDTMLVCSGTNVSTWDGTTATSVGTIAAGKLRDTYWSLDDTLIITDVLKNNVLKTWDGTTFGNLTTGLANPLYAKYSIVYNGRVWLFNITDNTTDQPHMILASAFENSQSYDTAARSQDTGFTTGDEAFFMLSPDLKPINGVVKFQNIVVFSTVDGKLFRLTGTDSTNYSITEFYSGSAALGTESIVNVGNDVMYMKRGGGIDALSSTQNFGDVTADDLSRWITDETAGLTDSLAVYDQQNQYVHFFVQDKVLTLDKEILLQGQFSPWSIYDTQHASLFNTKAARYVRIPGSTDYSIYWGDSSGNLFDLNGTGSGDAGVNPVKTYRKTRYFSELDNVNELIYGRVEYRRKGACTLQMDFDWGEEYSVSTASVPLKGPIVSPGTNFYNSASDPVYYGGTSYYNEGGVAEYKVSSAGFSPAGKGPGFFLTMTLNTDVNFLINKLTV